MQIQLEPPAAYGLDPNRLNQIDQLMARYIDAGRAAGMVTLVARKGRIVHLKTHGLRDVDQNTPMQTDTIFRIYSMTKPITAVALLMCLEETKFMVVDPVSEYIPAFADLQVMNGHGELEPAKRPITIQDLYRHTSGLTYADGPDGHPVDQMYAAADLNSYDRTNAEFAEAIARLPLRYHPGEKWHYSMGMDVLARLVEIFSGQAFGDFLQERIFDPLGMHDTGFKIPVKKIPRLATLYSVDGGGFAGHDQAAGVAMLNAARMEAGGSGLLSTISDYYRFAQCLLNGGELNGQRILGRKTVEFMRSNALKPHMMPIGFEGCEPFTGFGYGVCVKVMQDPAEGGWFGSPGDFGWGGMAETYHIIDPAEDLVAINMMQLMPSMHYPIRKEFRAAVYQALV